MPTRRTNPANLIGLDYRRPQAARLGDVPIVDAHVHLRGGLAAVERYFRVAGLYGVREALSMTPIDQAAAIRRAFPGRVRFIAVPDYGAWKLTLRFQRQWVADIRRFARLGARLCKFWMAPRALAERGLTLDHPWLRPMIDAALDAGMGFMVHVGDPDLWYDTRYSDASRFGTKPAAYEQLHWFCRHVAPRPVIGAHFVGHPEDLDHLDRLLTRHDNLMLDTSATKWIAREISRQRPSRVRRFFREHRERVLFGSDLVVDPKFDFAHYASRFWVHRALWESDYRGPSPIEDPDANGSLVRLRGVRLPDDVLRAIYRDNFDRLMARVAELAGT